MLRWLIVVLLALLLVQGLMPLLRRLGLGRLPGDLHFHALGRDWDLPVASTLLLSAVASVIERLI
ncbi:MAG: hypothetical protein RJA36_499 [Pseudomonadota bacterium]|jgi:hypothetical protein